MKFVYKVEVLRNDFVSILFQKPYRFKEIIDAESIEDANKIMENKRKQAILFDIEEDIESIEYSLYTVIK